MAQGWKMQQSLLMFVCALGQHVRLTAHVFAHKKAGQERAANAPSKPCITR